jgi:hypothetical protein
LKLFFESLQLFCSAVTASRGCVWAEIALGNVSKTPAKKASTDLGKGGMGLSFVE